MPPDGLQTILLYVGGPCGDRVDMQYSWLTSTTSSATEEADAIPFEPEIFLFNMMTSIPTQDSHYLILHVNTTAGMCTDVEK